MNARLQKKAAAIEKFIIQREGQRPIIDWTMQEKNISPEGEVEFQFIGSCWKKVVLNQNSNPLRIRNSG